ncbi:MAG: hypothetical protein D6806_06915 [Deltaproteobacteria bacterium]|nr:MAG: hypothetical protein D6806_06915 [Deltaproteobacteria bacterium]
MTLLNRKTLWRFVRLAGDNLRGDWVLMGGTVLALLGIGHRVTVDIDIAGPDDSGNEDLFVLMSLAHRLGLPVETINQAGAFFLRQINRWRDDIVLLHQGKTASIWRPAATLFVLLKLERFTEADLSDCLQMLQYATAHGEPVDVRRLSRAARAVMRRKGTSERKRERLERLVDALKKLR